MRDSAVLKYRGLMLEKLMARAVAEGISVDAVRRATRTETYLYAGEKDAKALMELARRFSLDVTYVNKSRSELLKAAMLRRWALLPALLIGACMVFLLSGRIWLVEVTVDATAAESFAQSDGGQAIYEALRQNGVMPGIARGAIDPDVLAISLQQAAPDYAFVGVRMTGVRLLVHAVRELPAPELYDIAGARDLVSREDAVVSYIEVRAGVAAVNPGDTVQKGQLLIRGEEKLTDEASQGICALGDVMARCWSEAEMTAETAMKRRTATGNERYESAIRMMDYAYPFTKCEPFAEEDIEKRFFPIGGLYLPLGIETVIHREVKVTRTTGDFDVIREDAGRAALEAAMAKMPAGSQMIDKWIDYSMIEGDVIRARAVVEYECNIAVTRGALNPEGDT